MTPDDVIFIEIRYASGKVMRAEGEDATEIWRWVDDACVMAHIRGQEYSGPKLKEVAGE